MPVSVSLVIATHNRAALLRRCFLALSQQLVQPAEIVVVDDASTDDTATVIGEFGRTFASLKVVALASNVGPAAARNRGIALASGPLIAFTDDDCEPAPGWLGELVRALNASPADVAGVGGRVLSADPGWIGAYMEFHRILEPPSSLAYLVTANAMFRRSALLEVGGFDERIVTPGGEDPGLSFALRRRGHRFVFAERAIVAHHFRESVFDFARTFFRYGSGVRHVVGV